MKRWTDDHLETFRDRSVVVTGGNSGIGWQAGAAFARHGAVVTLACRNLAKAEEAAARMRAATSGEVRVAELDLSSLVSVATFAQRWSGPLALLVNNAGVMAPPSWQATEDGFELQFGTNHLGHMALTSALMPALLLADAPRVVTVSSIAHHGGTSAVLEGNPPETYVPQQAYRDSKLANLLFARELQRRSNARGLTLTSTAAHPGVAATALFTDAQGRGSNPVLRALVPLVLPLFLASAKSGAQATLHAASVAAPGTYSGPQRYGEWRGPIGPARVSDVAADDDLAAALWDRSEEMLGAPFAWP